MKYFICFCFLFVYVHTLAQKNTSKSEIYLFATYSDKTMDTCICDDAYGFYYFTDKTGFIYWVGRSFCSRYDTYETIDTVKQNRDIIIVSEMHKAQHPVEYIFKFFVSGKNLMIVKKDTSTMRLDTTLYCTLDRKVNETKNGLFVANEIHGVQYVGDSTITFNNNKASCYIVKEIHDNPLSDQCYYTYLEKKTLRPMHYKQLLGPKSKPPREPEPYTLFGIMEVNEMLIDNLKLFKRF